MTHFGSGFWEIIRTGAYFAVILVGIDLLIVLFTMLQISNGEYTQHIGFWDGQIRFIMSLFSR